MNSNSRILLNLGCGPLAVKSRWVDCDGSWNAAINIFPNLCIKLIRYVFGFTGRRVMEFPAHVRYVNLNKPFPYADNSVDAVYASHVWEHLYYENAYLAARECHRILKVGGVIRLVVPDLRAYCESYLNSSDEDSAYKFHTSVMYRGDRFDEGVLLRVYNALTDFHTHKFMYDSVSLRALLSRAGFTNVRECGYLDSLIPEVSDVESSGRIGVGVGVVVEAIK